MIPQKKIPHRLEAGSEDRKPTACIIKPNHWKAKGDITFIKDKYVFFAQFQGKKHDKHIHEQLI